MPKEKTFDYVIMTEHNEWVATGKQETMTQLRDEIKRLKSEKAYADIELVVFTAKKMDSFSVYQSENSTIKKLFP